MKITLNNEDVDVDGPTTVAELLTRMDFPDKGIAVALDWAVLPRSEWATPLTDGARVDVMTAVQGG